MATREENLKKINDNLEKLSDDQLDEIAGGFGPLHIDRPVDPFNPPPFDPQHRPVDPVRPHPFDPIHGPVDPVRPHPFDPQHRPVDPINPSPLFKE